MIRPYRAPELLFSPTSYDPQAIDIWAAGCALAEFFTPLSAPSATSAEGYDLVDDDAFSTDLETPSHQIKGRQSLFDATYGDLGLAGSIFALKGSPNSLNWPVRIILLARSHALFTDMLRGSSKCPTRPRSTSRLNRVNPLHNDYPGYPP